MRNIFILIVTIVVLIIYGVWELNYMDKVTGYMVADINELKEDIEKKRLDEKKDDFENLKATWNSAYSVLDMIIDSDNLMDANIILKELEYDVEKENSDEIISKCLLLKENIKSIRLKKQIIIQNIM